MQRKEEAWDHPGEDDTRDSQGEKRRGRGTHSAQCGRMFIRGHPPLTYGGNETGFCWTSDGFLSGTCWVPGELLLDAPLVTEVLLQYITASEPVGKRIT